MNTSKNNNAMTLNYFIIYRGFFFTDYMTRDIITLGFSEHDPLVLRKNRFETFQGHCTNLLYRVFFFFLNFKSYNIHVVGIIL